MDQDALARSRVGTMVRDKWTLEGLLGVGGMAAVYVANHKIGRREAIKILHPDVARSPELRARFEQEAHVANRFQHPGAVEIRDIDVTEDGTPFLVMELLEGESVSTRAQRLGGLPLPEIHRLMDELLDVLAAAHAQGIIHRDIKPDNLFVLTDGRLKVLDFGIARIRDGLPKALRTRVGATLGTTPYMPPEQIKGLPIDARADLFAVGATMFRLIARKRLHEAATEADLLVKMASLPAPPLCSVAPDVPADTGLVVDRALQLRRDLRYPDALTMQADLRALRAGAPPPFALRRREEPDPPLEILSAPPAGWTTGEVAEPLPERTAAASPGARAAGLVAVSAPLTPAAITAVEGANRVSVEASTVPARPRGEEAPPPSSAIGVEASLPMPPSVGAISAPRSSSTVPVQLPAVAVVAPVPPSVTAPSVPSSGPSRATLTEPTLKSPGAPGIAPPAAAIPVRIEQPAPMPTKVAPAVVPLTRTLPTEGMASLPEPAPRRRPVLKLLFVGAFFLLLGATITLAWALHKRAGSDRVKGSDVTDAPDLPIDDPGGDAAPNLGGPSRLRPSVPVSTGASPIKGAGTPPLPTSSLPVGKGKGKGKGH